MLKSGESLEVPMSIGKTWELQAESSAIECYGLHLPLIVNMQQSGIFLHADIDKNTAQGKIQNETFQLDFTTHSGPCTGENISIRGDLHKENLLWPAVMESESCKKCAPADIMIHRQEG